MSNADTAPPLRSGMGSVPVMSRLTRRMALISLATSKSGSSTPASIISSTSWVVPSFRAVVVSDMFESPTMTCRRRKRVESACGSSRVLMIGRDRVVALDTPSHTWSARCEKQYCSGSSS